MKNIFVTLAAFCAISAAAQTSVKTETFVVKGNCDDCKDRIENAADIKGVKVVKWDTDTKVASATFDSDKTSLKLIQEAIAKSGYDAGPVKGNDKAYSKLPKCCQYRDGKCEEK